MKRITMLFIIFVLCLSFVGCASTGSMIQMTPDRLKAYQSAVESANATATSNNKVRGCIYEYFQGTSDSPRLPCLPRGRPHSPASLDGFPPVRYFPFDVP
jgi:hypothetical protein